MKGNQYTLRDVPEAVDRELRSRATRERQSLNAVALRVLAIGLGIGEQPACFRDLDALAGTWIEDPGFDDALRDMDTVDKDLWQ
jgi:plasmid stability protein